MNLKSVRHMVLVSILLSGPVRGIAFGQTTDPSTLKMTDPATVRTAQRALRDRGFYSGPINGLVEEETRKALLDFQQAAGIHATGLVDRATLEALSILEDDRSLLKKTGEGAVQTAQTVGEATVTGVTVAGKSTAKGVTVAATSTARGTTVAFNSTSSGLETAGKGVAKGGEATLNTAAKAGKTASGVVKKAGQGVTDFLGVSQSDNKIRKQLVKKLDRDPYLQDSQVHVLVERGVVTLTFSEGSPEDYDRTAAIARAVNGVKEVVVHSL